jgi:hypothetical protein
MPRPLDLRSAQQLAQGKPHGHKMRYMAGCRCSRCRAGNAAYERQLAEKRRLLGPNDLVSTDRVRAHLKFLQGFGMGHKTVAKHAGVGKTALAAILWYGKQQMRRRSEARVLQVEPTIDRLPKNTKIPAAETAAKIEQLVAWGYPKLLINRDGLGLESGGMQIRAAAGKTSTVAVKTALKIRTFFSNVERIRELWTSRRGAIPKRQYVYWKGRSNRFRLSDLELRPVGRAYSYHYIYPPELKSTIRLANEFKRAYRKRKRDEQQRRRTSEKQH